MSQTAVRTCWMQCDLLARTTTDTYKHGDVIEALRHASVAMHRCQLGIAKRSGFHSPESSANRHQLDRNEGLRPRTSLAMAMYPTSNTLAHGNSKIVVPYLSSSLTAANDSSTFPLPGYAAAWGRSPYPFHMDKQVSSRRRRYMSPLALHNINIPVWQTSINQRINNSLQIRATPQQPGLWFSGIILP